MEKRAWEERTKMGLHEQQRRNSIFRSIHHDVDRILPLPPLLLRLHRRSLRHRGGVGWIRLLLRRPLFRFDRFLLVLRLRRSSRDTIKRHGSRGGYMIGSGEKGVTKK